MEESSFPEKCLSDYNYIQGRCETPHYLKPKSKEYIDNYQAPVIITDNPEELTMDPPQVNIHQSQRDTFYTSNSSNKDSQGEENLQQEVITEEPNIQHPYENLINNNHEPK